MLCPKMALLFNIPLVFYGENEAEYGNPVEDNADAQLRIFAAARGRTLLGGESLASLKANFGMSQADLSQYSHRM